MKAVVASYGSRGDVEPCAAAARELLRRGHEVRVAAPPNLVGFLESAGLTTVAYGPDSHQQMGPAANLVGDFAATAQHPITMVPKLIEHLTRVNAAKSETLTALADGADLLVVGFNEQAVAANVAEYFGIPLAGLHFFPAPALPAGMLSTLATKAADDAQRQVLGLPPASESVPQRVAEQGSLEIQAYDQIVLPGPPGRWVQADGRHPFVGALTLQSPTDDDDAILAWIAEGAPPIYFGFGSTPLTSPAEQFAMISAACAQLGERALICAGPNDFGQMPHSHQVMVAPAVNHAAVFPACRAIVHHGGAGTTAAGLRAGIPMLIRWLWLDQPIWAAGIEELGVGVGQPFSAATSESLAAGLGSILAAQYIARARTVADQMTPPAHSIAMAADLLEHTADVDRRS